MKTLSLHPSESTKMQQEMKNQFNKFTLEQKLIKERSFNDRSMQENEPRPLKVSFNLTKLLADPSQPDVKSDFHKIVEYHLIPYAQELFAKLFTVNDRVGMPLIFPGYCEFEGVPVAPQDHYHPDSANVYTYDDAFAGALDTDVMIYMIRTDEASNVLGFAGGCWFHWENARPVAGLLSLNEYHYNNLTPSDMNELKATFVHEVMHILGFTDWLFPYFSPPNDPVPEANREADVTYNSDGHPVYRTIPREIDGVTRQVKMLITPNVQAHARAHYGDSSIEGVRMEDEGGGGSFNSHWEKILLGNEMMGAASTGHTKISKFTLAFFKDTGFYDTDFDLAEIFTWGKNGGLDFFNDTSCSTAHDEFCTNTSTTGCSQDHVNLTQCRDTNFSNDCTVHENRLSASCFN